MIVIEAEGEIKVNLLRRRRGGKKKSCFQATGYSFNSDFSEKGVPMTFDTTLPTSTIYDDTPKEQTLTFLGAKP